MAYNSSYTGIQVDLAISKVVSGINSGSINDGQITGLKIATGSVSTTKIASGSITSDKLGDNSVTTAKIQDSAISSVKLQSSCVSSAKLAAEAVTETKVGTRQIKEYHLDFTDCPQASSYAEAATLGLATGDLFLLYSSSSQYPFICAVVPQYIP